MATLEKKTLIGLLGQKAGTKLYRWLNPCCQITVRAEAICVDGKICIDYYATSPIAQKVVIQTTVLEFSNLFGVYNLIPGDNFLGRECVKPGGNPREGTYDAVSQILIQGEPTIGLLYTVDVPFCDA